MKENDVMKNRDNIYLVVRVANWPVGAKAHICGAYRTAQAADETAAKYNQQWKDRGWDSEQTFEVRITTFYED